MQSYNTELLNSNDSLALLMPSINNNNIYEFQESLKILSNNGIIITYYDYAKYLLFYVIKKNAKNILEYLLNNDTFEYYNNYEYLNYDFNSLKKLNIKNCLKYDFYSTDFTDIEHPLFYLLDKKNFELFDYILNYNVNVNIINSNGTTLLDYLYFKKDISNNIKLILIPKLLQKGATWEYVYIWKNICKCKYYYDINNLKIELKKYNNKYPLFLLKDLELLQSHLNNIYTDIYLLKYSNLK
jgi:hypothetical protein